MFNLNNGGCSLMVERAVVEGVFAKANFVLSNDEQAREFRKTRVRFSPSTFCEANGGKVTTSNYKESGSCSPNLLELPFTK